jgi:iron(III) transport system permease protein
VVVPVASLIFKAGVTVNQVGEDRIRSWSAGRCLAIVANVPLTFRDEFFWTAVCSIAAASLALVAAVLAAWPARRGGWAAIPAIVLAAVGLALPGPLVGIGLIAIFNHDWPPLIYLYDRTPAAPILAQCIRALPLTILICWHSMATLNADMLSAARLAGAGSLQILARIVLPQRWPAFFAAWLAALAIAAGDLAWSQLVLPPGMDNVQRRVFGLVHSGVEEQVAGICLVIILGYALLSALIGRLVRQPSV